MAAVLAKRRVQQTLPVDDHTWEPVPSEVNPAVLGGCLRIPRTAFTLDGFREWVLSDEFPEKLRATFISGEIYLDMSKEELETHASVKSETCGVLIAINRESRQGKFYLDGVLVTNKEANLSTNPDGVYVRKRSLRARRVRLVPRKGETDQYLEIEGTPDWVMEILSKYSANKDMVKLREAYHRARIPEYWLIDAQGEEIDFQILLWRKSGYATTPTQDGWQKSRVFGREFRLDRQRDELGLWEYTLHVR